MRFLNREYLLAVGVLLAACSGSGPSALDATRYLTSIDPRAHLSNLKVTSCSGDDALTTCVVSYDRQRLGRDMYEEFQVDFVRTPSGWTGRDFKLLQTRPR